MEGSIPAGTQGESWLMENRWPSAMSGVLLDVLADEFRHLEHVDRLLAAEDRFQRVVRVDHPLVLLVLQTILLDVGPQFLGDLGPRNRLGPHDLGQRCVRLDRLHERCVRLPLALRHVISSVKGARARGLTARAEVYTEPRAS